MADKKVGKYKSNCIYSIRHFRSGGIGYTRQRRIVAFTLRDHLRSRGGMGSGQRNRGPARAVEGSAMIPDIDRKNLNFILYETSRFNVRAREVPSQYKNYFAVELAWDENGEEKKKVCRYFTDYRLWWMGTIVHKTC